LRPGLRDTGERHGLYVEDDFAGGGLLEQAGVGGRGVCECGWSAGPAAGQLDGTARSAMAVRAATSPAVIPTRM
jgi:hypothetical protein